MALSVTVCPRRVKLSVDMYLRIRYSTVMHTLQFWICYCLHVPHNDVRCLADHLRGVKQDTAQSRLQHSPLRSPPIGCIPRPWFIVATHVCCFILICTLALSGLYVQLRMTSSALSRLLVLSQVGTPCALVVRIIACALSPTVLFQVGAPCLLVVGITPCALSQIIGLLFFMQKLVTSAFMDKIWSTRTIWCVPFC